MNFLRLRSSIIPVGVLVADVPLEFEAKEPVIVLSALMMLMVGGTLEGMVEQRGIWKRKLNLEYQSGMANDLFYFVPIQWTMYRNCINFELQKLY